MTDDLDDLLAGLGTGVPFPVDWDAYDAELLRRLWRRETAQRARQWLAVVAGAVAFPAVATGANGLKQSENALVLRFWSDGAVDATKVFSEYTTDVCSKNEPVLCTGPTTLIPGTCMADVDRNAIVGTSDLLQVLDDWGECAGGES